MTGKVQCFRAGFTGCTVGRGRTVIVGNKIMVAIAADFRRKNRRSLSFRSRIEPGLFLTLLGLALPCRYMYP